MRVPLFRSVLIVLVLVCLTDGRSVAQYPDVGSAATPLPDGTPLRADQFPRFVRPTHTGEFGFDEVVVLGDVLTLRVERPGLDPTAAPVVETWSRLDTIDVAGRRASVFRLAWGAEALEDAFRLQRWGVDRPSLWWGELVVIAGEKETRRDLYLQVAPPNIPSSTVVTVDDAVQYSSHAVNLRVPEYGDARVEGGEAALDLARVARRFYEWFEDEHDTLAVVSQTNLLMEETGFRRLVRNDIGGLGLPLFDLSLDYGSRGVLQGVEAYPPGGWASQRATLHQQAHQWGEYSGVWDWLGVERPGLRSPQHTPLLTPGEVMAGGALEATRRVSRDGVEGFRIERSLPMHGFHPLTLYRMGLISAQDLPAVDVFVDQDQLGEGRRVPAVGTRVSGDTRPVRVDDIVAVDGARVGPPVERIRRALIYVTRGELASQEEMDIVNFYAARVAAREGVTSWDGYPSFFEATRGRVDMVGEVTPRRTAGAGRVEESPPVSYLEVGADALAGVLLDSAIPGLIRVGDTVQMSGIVTADDRDDFTIACFRFIRYGASDANEVFVCSSVLGGRFAMDVRFEADQRGAYTVEPFLFWPGSGGQLARSRYGVVIVE